MRNPKKKTRRGQRGHGPKSLAAKNLRGLKHFVGKVCADMCTPAATEEAESLMEVEEEGEGRWELTGAYRQHKPPLRFGGGLRGISAVEALVTKAHGKEAESSVVHGRSDEHPCSPPQEVNGMLLFQEGQGAGLDQDDGRAGYVQEEHRQGEQEKAERWTTRHRRENVGGRLNCTHLRGGAVVQGAETLREQCTRAEKKERGRVGERKRGRESDGGRGRAISQKKTNKNHGPGRQAKSRLRLDRLGAASAGKRQKCELTHTRNDDECALRDCTGSQDVEDVDGEERMLRVGGDAAPASPLHARARCAKDNGECERREGGKGEAVMGGSAEEDDGGGHGASGREEGVGKVRASGKDRIDVDDQLRGRAGQDSPGEAQAMAEFLDEHPAIVKVHYRDGSRDGAGQGEGARQGEEGYWHGDMGHDDMSTDPLSDGDAGAARVEAGGRGRGVGRGVGSDEAEGAFEEAVKGKERGRRGKDTDAERRVKKKNVMTTSFWHDTYSLLADFRRRHGHLCLPEPRVPSSRDTGSNCKRFCVCACKCSCMAIAHTHHTHKHPVARMYYI